MTEKHKLYDWFIENWVFVGIPLAIFLIVISPFIFMAAGFPAILIYLLLPIYMFHQYEEHSNGQFKTYVNHVVGSGKEVLTDRSIFYVNVVGVWLAYTILLYLYVFTGAVWGLIAGYITVFNGLLHTIMSIRQKEYNPGLWTSLFLFIPLGVYTIYEISQQSGAGVIMHVIALVVAVLVHAAIFISAALKLRKNR